MSGLQEPLTLTVQKQMLGEHIESSSKITVRMLLEIDNSAHGATHNKSLKAKVRTRCCS